MERDPVGKALAVLMALCEGPQGPWSVRALARELGTSPATVHRVFSSFESRSLLSRGADGEYLPGAELFRLCRALRDGYSPVRLARPALPRLAERSGEAALFGAYDPGRREMMFLDVVQAAHPLHYDVGLHRWIPVHSGATGLAVLAFLPATQRRAIYRAGPARVTPKTLVDERRLEEACTGVADRGYALTVGQRVPGAVAIAAPVYAGEDTPFGVIAVALPEQRFDPAREQPLARLVLGAAAEVTAALSRVKPTGSGHTAGAGRQSAGR